MLSVRWVIGIWLFMFSFYSVLCDFEVVVLHTNDMHARFEETERNSGTCKVKNRKKNCVGGFARLAHEIRHFRKFPKKDQGVLFLNAGDTFTGTAWFSVSKANIVTDFINILKPDVIVSRTKESFQALFNTLLLINFNF